MSTRRAKQIRAEIVSPNGSYPSNLFVSQTQGSELNRPGPVHRILEITAAAGIIRIVEAEVFELWLEIGELFGWPGSPPEGFTP